MKKTTILCVMAALCLIFSAMAQTMHTLKGRVVDAHHKEPLAGAVIKLKTSDKTIITNSEGYFEIALAQGTYQLQVQYLAYAAKELLLQVPQSGPLLIQLIATENNLQEVQVVSTGYQRISKDKATGSFVLIDSALLSRRVGSNILDRLDGVATGLLFIKNTGSTITTNASPIAIRGRSTIYANPNPLIVVDNFPFNGDINSINPEDIQNITILKDAAAAAIWGAFSGNGVIVITTKKGQFAKPAQLSFNSNIVIGQMPNLNYAPRLSSANAVDLEEYLFNKGYYNARINSNARTVLSPVVELLLAHRNGMLSAADSASLIDGYKAVDTRNGLQQYFYTNAIAQRHNLALSGGSKTHSYYLSGGFDQNLSNVKQVGFNRISLNLSNTHQLLNDRLTLDYTFGMARNSSENNGMPNAGAPYPYISFLDANGEANSIPNLFRKSYIDTLGGGKLLDWRYRPLEELALTNNVLKKMEYRVNASLRYQLINHLNLTAQYQYNASNGQHEINYHEHSFYTRNYINQFTQYNAANQTYSRRVPLGGILDQTLSDYDSHNARVQFNYQQRIANIHELQLLGGVEQRWINQFQATSRLYGYNGETGFANLDYSTTVLLLPNNAQGQISNFVSQMGNYGRFRSAFANVNYGLLNKYQLSASLRKDQSNVFGVSTNQKGVPLWSIGAAWEISKEPFYQLAAVPLLKLRLSNGYQGNVDPSLSAMVTTTSNSLAVNYYNQPYSTLANPPNERLRWETVNTVNLGLDFKIGKVITASLEYYIKRGQDLIGVTNVDPTSGVATFKGNVAKMHGNGVDLSITSQNLNRVLKWQSTWLWSYTKDKVSSYTHQPTTLSSAISAPIGPIEGYPLYAIYALPWAGLDTNGDPQVYFNGQPSKNYSQVNNATNLDNLKYMGPKNPTVFGALRNDFQWKAFTFSANITYKFGHYFRNQAISYGDLFNGNVYQPDQAYHNRWQKAGDEAVTQVPALVYPANTARDVFYRNSSVHVEKGDLIRLQDIHMGYTIKKSKKWPFASTTVYAYLNNLGIIWKANASGVDPDLVPSGTMVYPNPRSYALGLKFTL
ncbi:MAG: SusC/RagA family TonB-linked outer membrane protein [Sphingobacteriales bacterium]|nr:MAG: SusC/RagA family TonB-linked outer membrane protein [Sphingobacteriales bacterium]